MLARRAGPGAACVRSAAGIDRGRVGERLQAALAGLQELHLLRERQGDRVRWALQMQRDRSSPPARPGTDSPAYSPDEQRLEATLTALKQQLSRLRRQDVGLKSHLQQLDEQISVLKLDVSKASTEHLESDSRPSSGFYDLSDGGSGSLSNSCTSVCSESLCSSLRCPRQLCLPEPRPRSADESSVPERVVHQGGTRGTRILTSAEAIDSRARQRPVSTGDLDRMTLPGLGFYKAPAVKIVSLCPGISNQHVAVDPKYQSDLVSRSGTDVYEYPSPLHAVALQSPIFSLSGESPPTRTSPTAPEARPDASRALQGKVFSESRPNGYISKLLQHSRSKTSLQPEGCCRADRAQSQVKSCEDAASLSPAVTSASAGGLPRVNGERRLSKDQSYTKPHDVKLVSEEQATCVTSRQELVTQVTKTAQSHAQELKQKVRNCPERARQGPVISCFDQDLRDLQPEAAQPRKPAAQHRAASHGNLVRKSSEARLHPDFVQAKFVPAGSQEVTVRQAGKKTKAVKLKRRGSEKLRTGKPLSWEELKEPPQGSQAPVAESFPCHRPAERRAALRPLGCCGDQAARWCSEARLCAAPRPGPLVAPRQQELSGVDPVRRKQARKWQSEVEISSPPPPGRTEAPPPGLCRPGMVRSVSMRPRPGPCAPRLRRPGSHCGLLSESELSEYAARCPSLFHSSVAESSESERSDFTANRFGDSESSGSSSSDSSLSLDSGQDGEGGELVWAEAMLGPTAARLPPPPQPEPPTCRIKASRALKKKIRRFQPAALKVMTMV
ncbi:dapper homolog 2 [Amia ocellicauda]|uniref:dapper homolog 2 n=1 Tax=Amia ocellicauda TaxID=2972642 RepID=UPI0034641776